MLPASLISSFSMAGIEEMRCMLSTVRTAQLKWSGQPIERRLAMIKCTRQVLAAQAHDLASAIALSTSRSIADSLVSEVLPLLDACRFLERHAAHILRPNRLGYRLRPWWLHGIRLELQREAVGVVLIIAPSNYPLLLPGVQLMQALVAGNAVLLKPADGGSAVIALLLQTLQQAGLDHDLLKILSPSPETAKLAIESGVDKVLLTGSTETGIDVLHRLAEKLTPGIMELSGCDAAFVCPEADLEQVSRALAFSLRFNNGATCIAPRRIFVPSELTSTLESYLQRAVETIPPAPIAASTRRRLRELIDDACAKGARHLTGAFRTDGQITPVVISRANLTMRLLQTDIFAPVLAIVPVVDEEQALEVAAQCSYALGATIFGDERHALNIAKRIQAGVVVINDVIVPTADPRLPFGGRGRSGFGVTRGAEGLLELTNVKAVSIRRGRWRPHFNPEGDENGALFESYIRAVHGESWPKRIKAMVSAIRVACRSYQC